MKNSIQTCLVLIFLIPSSILLSQGNCKVLKPEIAGSYSGKCKNGLANGLGIAFGTDRYEGKFLKGLPDGEGTYIWATGETYRGEWKEGKRNGEGEYTFSENGKDSTIYGNWQNDRYLGPNIQQTRIISKIGVDRFSIQKSRVAKNRVLFDLYQNGSRNSAITNLLISSSSGYDTNVGLSSGYDEITFPATLKITYFTMSKMKTVSYYVEFEVEIFEPGDWRVILHN
jgi:hypothetical protein